MRVGAFWKSLLVSAPYDLGSWVPLTRAQVFVAEFHSPSLGFVALHCSTPQMSIRFGRLWFLGITEVADSALLYKTLKGALARTL